MNGEWWYFTFLSIGLLPKLWLIHYYSSQLKVVLKFKFCSQFLWLIWGFFLERNLEDISPVYGVTDTPVLVFWWHLPWVLKPGWIPCILFYLCDPQIHLWYNTCWLYRGQHGSWALSIHILAGMSTSIWRRFKAQTYDHLCSEHSAINHSATQARLTYQRVKVKFLPRKTLSYLLDYEIGHSTQEQILKISAYVLKIWNLNWVPASTQDREVFWMHHVTENAQWHSGSINKLMKVLQPFPIHFQRSLNVTIHVINLRSQDENSFFSPYFWDQRNKR